MALLNNYDIELLKSAGYHNTDDYTFDSIRGYNTEEAKRLELNITDRIYALYSNNRTDEKIKIFLGKDFTIDIRTGRIVKVKRI